MAPRNRNEFDLGGALDSFDQTGGDFWGSGSGRRGGGNVFDLGLDFGHVGDFGDLSGSLPDLDVGHHGRRRRGSDDFALDF